MVTIAGEARLVEGAQAGDQAAFEDLLRPWVAPAANFAFTLLGDRQEAEDAVQEAALRAWRKLDGLRAGAPFGPWFLGVVSHQCRSMRRRRWYRLARDPLPEHMEAPEEPTADADLRHAISRLDDKQRAAIILHYYLDLTVDQVAHALGLTPSGVKSRLNRALKRLRPLLAAAEEDIDG
jgi:RNA polymerase sigma factor (sigma-70 family)